MAEPTDLDAPYPHTPIDRFYIARQDNPFLLKFHMHKVGDPPDRYITMVMDEKAAVELSAPSPGSP